MRGMKSKLSIVLTLIAVMAFAIGVAGESFCGG